MMTSATRVMIGSTSRFSTRLLELAILSWQDRQDANFYTKNNLETSNTLEAYAYMVYDNR